jgi:hypothetical protein
MGFESYICFLFISGISVRLDGLCFVRVAPVLEFKIELPLMSEVRLRGGLAGWKADEALDNCLVRAVPFSAICYYQRIASLGSSNAIPEFDYN